MSFSTSPASRNQFANSMPTSMCGLRCNGADEREDTAAAQTALSATFSATRSPNLAKKVSKDGRVAPQRPTVSQANPRRFGRQPSPREQQNTTKLLHTKSSTTPEKAAAVPTTATGLSGAASSAALTSNDFFPFDVFPPTVIFNSYEANTTYTATLELKNRTAFNKHVRVDRPNACTAFELSAPRGVESSSKVAPGLSVTYTVAFTPTSGTKDYMADLIVRTDDVEPLIVPVRAYASRGCLHLPAALSLNAAPIKGSSTTPLFLRNASELACTWRAVVLDPSGASHNHGAAQMDTDGSSRFISAPLSSCFSITPHNGVVAPLCPAGGQTVTVAPVTLHFHPNPHLRAAQTCNGLLRFFLGPEGDVVQDVRLSAQAVELHGVILEESEVTLADTYVTTERQTVVRVRNESDETIFFAWKSAFRDGVSGEGGVNPGNDLLDQSGGQEDSGYNNYYHDSIEDVNDGNCGRGRRRPTRPTATDAHRVLSISQHQHHYHAAHGNSTMEDDRQQHQPYQQTLSDLYEGDESFQIEPLSGVLYGRGTREFTITFNPHLAVQYESIAYLDVTGAVNRIPLIMRGHGVGPQCKLEYNHLDIGDVYLNAVHEYTVTMENTSAIECQYIIMPPLPITKAAAASPQGSITPAVDFASKFRFSPSHGSLAPGETVKLRIELKSDRIGSFAETFHVHMQGAVEEVPLLLKGRVLGPHFQCDVDELDFGNVSYNMEHTRTMHIENTSPIPMHYSLHLPDDCAYASDFVITPAEGVIAPRSAEVVQVFFRSRTVGDYETALLVEVADVGDVLDAIPLKATCMVPILHSSTTELTYGGVFVGYPTTLNVAISNDTALTGMFNFQLLNGEALAEVAMVELPVPSEHDDGVHWISPHQTMQLPVTLTALKPGRLHFSLALNVLGRDASDPSAAPLTILVSAVASGPHVELQPSNVQFGTLFVLTEEVRELTLKNTSPVPAPFALVFDRYGTVQPPLSVDEASVVAAANEGKTADPVLAASTLPFPRVPVFSVEPTEGVLEPHSSLTVRVRAKPDDAMAFVDTLRLRRSQTATSGGKNGDSNTENSPKNGGVDAASAESEVMVTVKVTGHGVPILADRALESIELGDVLTTLPVAETVTLHNYGRREQEVQWQNTRGSKVKEGESPVTFTYKPEWASIPAGGSAVFALCGNSTEVGTRTDTFILKQSGTFKEVLRSTVKATFIAPTLSCSSRAINFEYANTGATTGAAAAPVLVKSLTIKNITSKTLVIALRIKSDSTTTSTSSKAANAVVATPPKSGSPFGLEGPPTVTLVSGESYVVGVRCNPLYRGDYTSHKAKAKLQLSFAEHDRKEFVSLVAVLHFPSIVLNPSTVVDFGTILTNTEQRRSVELYNPSRDLPASFCWFLRPHGNSANTVASQAEETTATTAAGIAATAAAVGSPTEAKGSVDSAGESPFPTRVTTASTTAGGATGAVTNAKVNGFDIIPFFGTLLPGEKATVEVAFQGTDMGAALAVAVCHLAGGPTYTLDLRAAANIVQAHCDKTYIDFGRLPYYESASKVVTLTNTTQVQVPWQVDLSKVRHPECLKVSPTLGVLRDKARLQITFLPQVPDVFEEDVWVRIGHLDPQPIHVRGSGYMSRVAIVTTTPATSSESAPGPAVATSASGGSGGASAVVVYRAPFGAFTQALQEVEASFAASGPGSDLPNSAGPSDAPGMTVTPPTELPAALRKYWPTLEAERLAFCRTVREKATGAADARIETATPPLFLAPRVMHRNSATALRTSGSSTTKLILARYVVDFGHLTRHDVRKTKLTVINPSSEGVSVAFDSKELAKLPVSVEPTKSFKVAAHEATTLELTMDATRAENIVSHGENAHEFTLDIKNGPVVVIECRSYVANPTLRAKEKVVDFGAVLLGEVKVLPVVLTNPEAVACPWHATCKEFLEGDGVTALQGRQSSRVEVHDGDQSRVTAVATTTTAATEDENTGVVRGARKSVVQSNGSVESGEADCAMPEFWVKQDRGVVPASGSLTIEVYYAPKNTRARMVANSPVATTTASTAQLKFRCGNGAASSFFTVKLTGTARHYRLHLDSEQLQLPPARPNQVLHESVILTNDEDHPVEVFNVALDPRHANEVKLLRRAVAIDVNHEVLLPPILAGDYLPDALLESVFNRVHADAAAVTEVPRTSSEAGGGAATGVNAGVIGGGPGVSVEANGAAGGNKTDTKPRSSTGGEKSSAHGSHRDSRRASAKIAGGDVAGGMAVSASAQGTGVTAGSNNSNSLDGSSNGAQPSLLLLVGPPRSGKTCLAQQWLEKEPCTTHLVDLDILIRAEAERDDTANAAVARCLLTRAAENAAAAELTSTNAASVPTSAGETSNEANKKEAKTADACKACVPALLRDLLHSFLTTSIQQQKACIALANNAPASAPAGPAATSLRFVVDGLRCGVLANQWTLYELINSVCAALRIPVHIVSLHVSTPMSNVRAARALEAQYEAIFSTAALTPISEAAYEALGKAERNDYNCRLKYMNDCRRDLQAAQQEQRRWAAQLPHPSVQAELEESLRRQQAEAVQESMARLPSAQKGGPAKQATDDKAVVAGTGLSEMEWRALDPAGQFCAWYKHFLYKFGCPPSSTTVERTAATAPAPTRPTGSSKSGGAAAAAAAAQAQDLKTGWSRVLSVNAEMCEPAAVAEDVERQLVQQSGTNTGENCAGAVAAGGVEGLCNSTGGGGDNAGEASTLPASPGLASNSQQGLLGTPSDAFVSRVGKWFYLNEARLRCLSTDCASAMTGGAAAAAAESNTVVESSALASNGAAKNGETATTAATAEDATTAAHRYVRFFSTMEREVVPVKKKSVPSVVLQKEEVTRWTLPAHSSVTLTLEFCSDHVGKFAEKCIFGVVGSLQQLSLTVSAVVALPDISRDPKDIFPVVRPRLGAGGGGDAAAAAAAVRRLAKVYIASKKVFDFGALLFAPPPGAKGRRRSNGGWGGGHLAGTGAAVEKTSPPPSTAGRDSSVDRTRSDSNSSHNTPFEETLTFVNREPAEADVTLSFMNDKEKTFTVTPTVFTLQPGATQRVQLRATPDKPGDFTNTLVACIKDNPVPWKAVVMCTGARPTLSINGSKESLEADFGRLVLRRSLVKSFTLANDGAVPLFWRLVPVQEVSGRGGPSGSGGGNNANVSSSSNKDAAGASSASLSTMLQWPAELQCSTMEGVLEENEVQTLEMTFAPTHPCLHSRTVNFLVSEVGQPQAVYETIPMTVKAEGYDVVVEWTRELQLGVLHVGEEKKEVIRIMNKCPYDIGYQLRMPKRLQKVLKIAAPSGTLRGMMGHKDAAIATIDVVARIDKEGELPAKLSVVEVAFFDVEKQELLYPLQTIPVYGEAWYTKYSVHPPNVSFGSCMVGQPRESTFELTNTGRFPIEFSLFNYREASSFGGGGGDGSSGTAVQGSGEIAASGAAAHATGGDVTLASRRSLRSLKDIENDFVVGAFTCRPGQGIVPVGGTQVITVSTVPSQQNRTHETVGVRVAQSGPELERYGTPVEISAYPAAPSIAADLTSSADVETIFEEQRVVYRLEQLPKGARAYSKEERLFSFGTVLLGQRCEERFRIANSSPLPCAVAVQLEGIAGGGCSGGGNNGGGISGTGNGRRSILCNSGSSGGAGDAVKLEGFDLFVEGRRSAVGAAAAAVSATSGKTAIVRFTLPPFENRFVTVAFTPTSLNRLQAQFVATVDNAAGIPVEDRGDAGQQLRFGLCGEGTLPTVELVLPRRYSTSDAGRSRRSVSGTGEHLRSLENSAGSDKKKNTRRRQGGGGAGSMSITNLHADGHGAAGGGAGEVLEMPLTRLGAVATRSFTICNTGCVDAQVLLDLLDGTGAGDNAMNSSTFLSMSVGVTRSSAPQQLQHDTVTEPCRKLEVVVLAGESQTIFVTYAPSQVELTTTHLRLVLVDNPFEDKEVLVVARSFQAAITFEGIDPASADYVDFGDCYLGVDKTCTFSARNNTDSLLRYVWEVPSTVRITPSIGHMPAGASRTFAATVCSTVEDLSQRVHCALHAKSILVMSTTNAVSNAVVNARAIALNTVPGTTTVTTAPSSSTVSEWDNSLQNPKWVLREDDADVHPNAATYLSAAAAVMGRRNLKQVMEAVPEPAYTAVDEVVVTQPLTIGYRCSVPIYQCQLISGAAESELSPLAKSKELKAISFAHTYLLQKRVAVVRLTNTGSVALPYSCIIVANAFTLEAKEAGANDLTTQDTNAVSSWTAAQLSAAAAAGSGGGNGSSSNNNSPNMEALPDANSSPAADFAVVSASWTTADAAAADVHVVDAGTYVDLNVVFTPRTAGLLTAELLLRFPHSEPREVLVPLQGVAECPLVHFKVPPPAAGASAGARKGSLRQSSSISLRSPTSGRTATSAAAGPNAEQSAEFPVVVDFLARGLHTKATVRFPVVNPTSGTYSYEWIEDSANFVASGGGSSNPCNSSSTAGAVLTSGTGAVGGGMVSPFRCLTTSGVIAAGRSVEAAFEFFADALGTRESTWSFCIPGRAVVPFRLRGNVVEPNVYLHVSKVDFDHVQVGTRVERTVMLENCDDVPFPFTWDKQSLEGTSTFLSVKPLRGTIAPRERLPVLLSFAPQEEIEYNVPLRCTVKKSSVPLSINVKGVGICVHDTLQIEPVAATPGRAAVAESVAAGEVVTVLRGQPLTLDLDRVQVNTTVARRFVLRNTGTYPFHYSVDTPVNACVRFDSAEGTVDVGQNAVMVLQYTPTTEETLKQCRLVFRIEGGVAYKVSVRAVSYLPRLRLSFDHYNFGPQFIAAYKNALSTSLAEVAVADLTREGRGLGQPVGPVTHELQLTNVEAETIFVECCMSTQNAWCKLDCTSLVVRPKETVRLKLTFAPVEVRHYEDVLELCLNKVHTTRLQIEGEGVAPRVEVVNPFAKLGTVRVGESRTVEVRLQCLSKIPTPVSFARAVDEDLQSKGISIALPGQDGGSVAALSTMLILKPKDAVNVSVVFAPTHRMSEFSREVKMLVCGVELPFVSVSGSCADAEVHLDTSHLEFRDVVLGATATRKVVILNSGDLSQKFSWVNSLQQLRAAGEWSITPATGFVRAHTEVACEVRYTPAAQLSKGVNSKRKTGSAASPSLSPAETLPLPPLQQRTQTLKLELDSAPAVLLSIDANAVTRPAATETVQFACRAGESDTKTIEVANTTDQLWSTEPIIDSALWSCPPLVTLRPLSTTAVPVTYNPTRPTIRGPAVTSAAATTTAAAAGAPRRNSPTMEGNDKKRQSTFPTTQMPQQQQQEQEQKDKGLFFVPLPDGTGRCVALEGTSEAAGPTAPLQRHDAFTFVSLPLRFQVRNWSSWNTLRFRNEVQWTAGPGMEEGAEDGAQAAIRVHENNADASDPKKAGGTGGSGDSRTAINGNSGRRSKAGGKGNSATVNTAALRGAIEVPAKASKEFILTVTPLREGTFRGVVHFFPIDKNGTPVTDESTRQFFEIEINAKPAPPAAPTTVELRAAIRDVATFNIPLTNPLSKSVEFTFRLSAVDGAGAAAAASPLEGLTLPTSVVVPAQSHGKAAVTFFPLLYKNTLATVQCAVAAPELGSTDVYVFRLITTTEAAAPERPTQVVCPLGQHVAFALRFTHYAKTNTEFAIRLGGELLGKVQSSFSRVGGGSGQGATVRVSAVHGSAAAGAAPRGQEVVVEFNYEPSEMGEERTALEFVSPVAGTYTFPIVAICTAPQRQGPFSTRAGQNLQLPFKNVFHEPVNIFVSSDSPAFVPVKKTETVPAHKTTNVVLQCRADEDKDVVRGRVSVTCTPSGKSPQQSVEWLYYVEVTGGTDRAGTGKQSGRKK